MTRKKGGHIARDDWKEVESLMQMTWRLEVRRAMICVESVGELTGLLVTSSSVSSVRKEVICNGIVRRSTYAFIVTSHVISSPTILPGWYREIRSQPSSFLRRSSLSRKKSLVCILSPNSLMILINMFLASP